MENALWLLIVFYFLGSFVYYRLIFEEQYQKSFDELNFENMFFDVFVIIFWLPYIAFNIFRLIISFIYYFIFKFLHFFDRILFRERKKKKE